MTPPHDVVPDNESNRQRDPEDRDSQNESQRQQDPQDPKPQRKGDPDEAESVRRDPEDRPVDPDDEATQKREKMHDKTLADSFPTSDPPSTIPDPAEDEEAA